MWIRWNIQELLIKIRSMRTTIQIDMRIILTVIQIKVNKIRNLKNRAQKEDKNEIWYDFSYA